MRPPESFALSPEEGHSLTRFDLNPALMLSQWTAREDPTEDFGHMSDCFSPSGRLFFVKESRRSLRVADLFSGNFLSIVCPDGIGDFTYLPLTETGGVLYNDRKFVRAILDLEGRRMIPDWETEETLPPNLREILFTRLTEDSFGFTTEITDSLDMTHIRWLGATKDAQKWLRIETPYYRPTNHINSMFLHRDQLYLYTIEDDTPLVSYSLAENQWKVLRIEGLFSIQTYGMEAVVFEELLVTNYWWMSAPWRLVVVAPSTRDCYTLNVEYPRDIGRSEVDSKIAATEFGIIGVVEYRKAGTKRYQAHLINIKKPLPLGLCAHFSLLNSNRKVANLPSFDPIPPIFGRNRYRCSNKWT